ncbi:DUF2334 domain-containing protein [Wenzhouxiangella sp. XN79A]|uniref:polysaccharide deacetylase family protein n=1 Tax=Wenzhouxiangella sp. XN79A TaxID=2724193 RepID=UPI00144A8DF1|nr:polysaccharide deacetylase family protein [Wenzhouxiangella sp. XN79A]NKI35337.1 DUF2334 domain-containing protein [Wenzhouxiangella sp. XN79A]
MKLLVSIHDVMPETLDRVRRIFDRLVDAGLVPITLLVVPGRDWTADHLRGLRALLDDGAELAGHGWTHEIRRIRGPKHALHSALISRRAGEHLALSRFGILRLMLSNRAWFDASDLPAPALYVPPAWAMGPVPRSVLKRLPFDLYETTGGVFDARSDRYHRLPMAGFETDTAFRAAVVRPFNALNRAWARSSGTPLRFGIHPDDFELRLADDLQAMIDVGGQCLSYRELG